MCLYTISAKIDIFFNFELEIKSENEAEISELRSFYRFNYLFSTNIPRLRLFYVKFIKQAEN